jgi:hypothetical protein
MTSSSASPILSLNSPSSAARRSRSQQLAGLDIRSATEVREEYLRLHAAFRAHSLSDNAAKWNGAHLDELANISVHSLQSDIALSPVPTATPCRGRRVELSAPLSSGSPVDANAS